jgi:hypothetical protein
VKLDAVVLRTSDGLLIGSDCLLVTGCIAAESVDDPFSRRVSACSIVSGPVSGFGTL